MTLRSVIYGPPGVGSTTFVGLLYLTMTRVTAERPEAFRFSAPPESIRRLTSLFGQLVAGDLATPLGPSDSTQVEFQLAFARPPGWTLFHRSDPGELRGRAELRFVRAAFADVARALAGGAAGPGIVPAALGADVPVFLVDAAPAAVSSPTTAAPSQDDGIASVLEALAPAPRPTGGRSTDRLAPIFVFTRLDAMAGDPRSAALHGKALTEELLETEGGAIGARLTEVILPKTAAFCRSHGTAIEPPRSFLSFLHRVDGSAGTPGRLETRVRADHRPEPVYPTGQYRALLDALSALVAHRT